MKQLTDRNFDWHCVRLIPTKNGSIDSQLLDRNTFWAKEKKKTKGGKVE